MFGLIPGFSGKARLKSTIKIQFNARALIINSAFSIEGDGHLLEATLFGNVQEKNGLVYGLRAVGNLLLKIQDFPQHFQSGR